LGRKKDKIQKKKGHIQGVEGAGEGPEINKKKGSGAKSQRKKGKLGRGTSWERKSWGRKEKQAKKNKKVENATEQRGKRTRETSKGEKCAKKGGLNVIGAKGQRC